MAINGSLREASLPDVLQLLSMGRKTGCLALTHRNNFGSIWFESGRISYASIVNRRDRIGERLVQAGVITADRLGAAIAAQDSQPDSRLGDVLVASGDVTRELLNDYLRVQVEETVYLLYTWNEGVFTFDAGARPPSDHLVSISPESLMLEGARRADEWSLIASSVPAFDLVFAVQRAAPVDALTQDQELVVRHLDGKRDVTHVAEACGLTDLDVGKVIHELLGAGLVVKVDRNTGHNLQAIPAGRLEEHRNLGVAFFRTGMLDEALREFRRVLELDATDAHANAYYGLVLLRRNAWPEAVEHFRNLTAQPDAQASAFHNLAFGLERLGQYAEAIVALERALAIGGDAAPRIRTSLGVVTLLMGDAERARDLLDDARSCFTTHPTAPWYHYAALATAWLGDRAAAIELLREGLSHHPRAAALHNNLAAMLVREGANTEALAAAERSIAEDPALAHPHKTVGDLYYRGGRYDKAFDAYERAVKAEPSLGADVYLKLGNIHLRRQERDAAAACWARALALDPANAIVRKNLDAIGQLAGVGAQ